MASKRPGKAGRPVGIASAPRRSLSQRTVAGVALGLAMILLLFGLLAASTVRESTEAAYSERVALARALARHVDDVLRYAMVTLERGAVDLSMEAGQPLTEAQRSRLAELRLQVGMFARIAVADASGRVLWSGPVWAETMGNGALFRDHLQRALQTGEPHISEYAPDGQSSHAFFVVPIRDASHRPVSALMAGLDPGRPTLNLLPSGDVGQGMYFQLINDTGRVLAGTQAVQASSAAEHQTLLADLLAARQPGYRLHQPAAPGPEADTHLVAYAPVTLLPSWGILVEQPTDVVVAMPRWLEQRLAIFGLGALLIAAGVAWMHVRGVVQPLKHLTATAERFASGHLDDPVRLNRNDELGLLARAFDTMRAQLRASLDEVAEWNRELERRVAARTAEVERRSHELAQVNAIAETVGETLDEQRMLQRALDRSIELIGADIGCLRIAESDGSRLALAAQRGLPAEPRVDQLCGSYCICARAARLKTVVVSDADVPPGASASAEAADLGTRVAVPLLAGEQVQGVLFLAARERGRFKASGVSTLSAIGRSIGMGLANTRLYESLRAREKERAELLQRVIVAQEEERRRLAQELHDETSQALASLQLGLERLAMAKDGDGEGQALARSLQEVASSTLASIHRLAVNLRPSVLDDVGLVAALERYLQESAKRSGLALDFAAVGVERFRLLPAAETAVYRIAQAALTNVLQHAQAQHASVLLERRGDNLVMVVEDDGRGFDLATVRTASLEQRLGLAGMEERARLIGAALTIETTPGAGTTVFLEVPLQASVSREGNDEKAAHHPG